MEPRSLDLICIGRSGVDLYADQLEVEIEEVQTFSKHVGGASASVAIGTSRLGLNVGLVSKVGKEPLGKFILKALREENVNTDYVGVDSDRLTGLSIFGIESSDQFSSICYRKDCAGMVLSLEDIPKGFFEKTKAVLLTGSHFSNPEIAQYSKEIARMAHEAQAQVILDIDYTSSLWKSAQLIDSEEYYEESLNSEVYDAIHEVFPFCNLIIGSQKELLLATNTRYLQTAIEVLQRRTKACVIEKNIEQGCCAYLSSDSAKKHEGFAVNVFNTLGVKNAFLSGFLRGWIESKSIEESMSWGNACGAIVASRKNSYLEMPYEEELQEFFRNQQTVSKLQPVHRQIMVANKLKKSKPCCLITFDHRDFFDQYLRNSEASFKDVEEFKALLAQSVISLQERYSELCIGAVVDQKYGTKASLCLRNSNIWQARCIEQVNVKGISFIDKQESYALVKQWPSYCTVKALVKRTSSATHIQEVAALKNLYKACCEYGNPLIIEIVSQADQEQEDLLNAMKLYYEKGIYPSYWKLPLIREMSFWNNCQNIIEEYDPYNQGILVLGEGKTANQLSNAFSSILDNSMVNGVALGRCFWEDLADKFLCKQINYSQINEEIHKRFAVISSSLIK
jgi:5-dehydro-2-deoxygluconokinase